MWSCTAVVEEQHGGIQSVPAAATGCVMKAPLAAAIAVVIAVVAAPVLVLVGAFSLRLLLGVENYRDSAAWLGVVVAAVVAAGVVGVLAYRGLVTNHRSRVGRGRL